MYNREEEVNILREDGLPQYIPRSDLTDEERAERDKETAKYFQIVEERRKKWQERADQRRRNRILWAKILNWVAFFFGVSMFFFFWHAFLEIVFYKAELSGYDFVLGLSAIFFMWWSVKLAIEELDKRFSKGND